MKLEPGTVIGSYREESFVRCAIEHWRRNPVLEILGNPDLDRLSIVSFVVRHDGRYLHHNYVVALLTISSGARRAAL